MVVRQLYSAVMSTNTHKHKQTQNNIIQYIISHPQTLVTISQGSQYQYDENAKRDRRRRVTRVPTPPQYRKQIGASNDDKFNASTVSVTVSVIDQNIFLTQHKVLDSHVHTREGGTKRSLSVNPHGIFFYCTQIIYKN